MKVAIIGSRNKIVEDLGKYLPEETEEIVSGGAIGIDRCARSFAKNNGIRLTEFLPDYEKYGRVAPLKRNNLIVDYADTVIAFWDGKSKGTEYTIKLAKKQNKIVKIYKV